MGICSLGYSRIGLNNSLSWVKPRETFFFMKLGSYNWVDGATAPIIPVEYEVEMFLQSVGWIDERRVRFANYEDASKTLEEAEKVCQIIAEAKEESIRPDYQTRIVKVTREILPNEL